MEGNMQPEMNRGEVRSRLMLAMVATALALPTSNSIARGTATIVGGPAWDDAVNTGYTSVGASLSAHHALNASAAIVIAHKTVDSQRRGSAALCWDTTGAVTELLPLSTSSTGESYSSVGAINAGGTVVGGSAVYAGATRLGARAVRWTPDGTVTMLDSLGLDATGSTGYYGSVAVDLNDAGTAIGSASKFVDNNFKGTRAVRWDAGQTSATELDALGTVNGTAFVDAVAINASGLSVGWGSKASNNVAQGIVAIRWDAGGTAATELGTLDAAGFTSIETRAFSVNDDGTIVGNALRFGRFAEERYAVRWDAGGVAATRLEPLTHPINRFADSLAVAISASGTTIGSSLDYTADGVSGVERAVQWDAGQTTPRMLGSLADQPFSGQDSHAYAINASNVVVGSMPNLISGDNVAVAWFTPDTAVDLNELLSASNRVHWTLRFATGINDTGWISGLGFFDPDGAGPLERYDRAFLIQVPEPSLLAVSCIIYSARRSRRRVSTVV
jgi:uncharacterized membrane protein